MKPGPHTLQIIAEVGEHRSHLPFWYPGQEIQLPKQQQLREQELHPSTSARAQLCPWALKLSSSSSNSAGIH